MKKLTHKPCRICGEPVTPIKRTDRNAYYYPRQCKKCFHVSRNPEARRQRISIAMGGMNHPRAVPLFTERIVDRKGLKYAQIKIGPKDWVYKHRWMMEQHLGRKLKRSEVVHHKDEDTLHNTLDNFKLMSNGCHLALHTYIEVWSFKYSSCLACGTTNKRHEGHGLCTTCYQHRKTHPCFAL